MSRDTTDIDARDRVDMKQLASGHGAALNRLMERHATAVFGFLSRMLNNVDDANDLAQETFVRVYQARDAFDPTKKFSTWLFTIAANLARNQIRWRTRHPDISLEAEPAGEGQALATKLTSHEPTPAEVTLTEERAQAVRAAVQGLPTDLREALVLCEWEEFKVAEAAVILQTTSKAVESRLYRARQILRAELKTWLG